MRAYKGFHKDLNCTMGKGVFYYEPGKMVQRGGGKMCQYWIPCDR